MISIALLSLCAPNVAPDTMQVLVQHESSGNPFAIGVNKGQRLKAQPTNAADAKKIADDLIKKGIDFDAGLGQINVRNWKWLGLTSANVFDACTNLKASQVVLENCFIRAKKSSSSGDPKEALLHAFSCYNTNNFKLGYSNGYVAGVLNKTKHIYGKK